MNIVDSSGWLEYFADGPNAKYYVDPLNEISSLMIPVITIYEVFKVVLRESSENDALLVVAAMQKGRVIDLDTNIAMAASRLSLRLNLAMADSVILATARAYGCVVWTQDSDFQNIEGIRYFPA
jgi:toxin FitB